jgi:hypothetical protein
MDASSTWTSTSVSHGKIYDSVGWEGHVDDGSAYLLVPVPSEKRSVDQPGLDSNILHRHQVTLNQHGQNW